MSHREFLRGDVRRNPHDHFKERKGRNSNRRCDSRDSIGLCGLFQRNVLNASHNNDLDVWPVVRNCQLNRSYVATVTSYLLTIR